MSSIFKHTDDWQTYFIERPNKPILWEPKIN